MREGRAWGQGQLSCELKAYFCWNPIPIFTYQPLGGAIPRTVCFPPRGHSYNKQDLKAVGVESPGNALSAGPLGLGTCSFTLSVLVCVGMTGLSKCQRD